MNPVIEAKRIELSSAQILAPDPRRVLFIGRSVNGTTDIVSCLYRALLNLGHHVFNLDTKVHSVAVSNPHRLQGGNGPIYVSLAYIEPILKKFRPQMIILCAGGLTFSEEDAAKLRERGIITVGVTLSDPDVFPGVVTYAKIFDFHTTNASHAMGMYHDAGVENTLYFPFGIDRGFVTQPVPRAPELAADVICLGHATNRPDRNSMMTRLAAKFNVKTYGSGWELPNSEIVGGRRLLQASREGRIHVNFPATRAGYTNVKCGVFETIGSGALLSTSVFEEMGRFFEYGQEIIGYNNHDELAEQIEAVLTEPGRYRAMTEAAFNRLTKEHLYEHRWLTLFAEIEALVAKPPAWLADRAPRFAEILAEPVARTKRVIVSGFYGASNLGDELLLQSIAGSIEKADPSTQVVVCAENPRAVEALRGYQAFPRRDHGESAYQVKTASAVVVGGGGLWHDYTFLQSGGLLGLFMGTTFSIAGFSILPLLGTMRDVPFFVTGLGVGPLDNPEARRMVRFVGEKTTEIVVRDEDSKALLDEILGDPSRTVFAPDLVYALDLTQREPVPEVAEMKAGGRRLVGLSLRKWAREGGEDLVERMAEALDVVARSHEIAIVGIPMQLGEVHDQKIIKQVYAAMTVECPRMVLPPEATAEQFVWTLEQCDLLIGMRLHACLLAHRLGTPVVGLAYDDKVAHHFAQIGRASFAHRLTDPVADIAATAVGGLERGRSLPSETVSEIRRLEEASSAQLERTAKRIAESPANYAVYEIPEGVSATAAAKGASDGKAKAEPVDPSVPVTPTIRGVAQSLDRNGAPLAHSKRLTKERLLFQIDDETPAQDTFLTIELDVPTRFDGGFMLSFDVLPGDGRPIKDTKTAPRRARLFYEIRIDDQIVISDDMEAWREANTVRIYGASKKSLRITATVRFTRPVGRSSLWKRFTCLRLQDFRWKPVAYEGAIQIAQTSPFAKVSKVEAEASAA